MSKKVLLAAGAIALGLGLLYGVIPQKEALAPPVPPNAQTEEDARQPLAEDAALLKAEPQSGGDASKPPPSRDDASTESFMTPVNWDTMLEKLRAAVKTRATDSPTKPVASKDIPEENGAYYFLLAREQLSDDERDLVDAKWSELGPDAWRDPEILTLFESYQDAFDAIRVGVELGNAMLPLDPNGPYTDLSYLLPYRSLARLMTLEGRMFEAAGDYDAAIANFATVLGFGNESPRGGSAINGLVGYAISATASEALINLLQEGDLNPQQYRDIVEQMQGFDERAYSGQELQTYEADSWDGWFIAQLEAGGDLRTVYSDLYDAMNSESGLSLESQQAIAALSDEEAESLFEGFLQDRQALIESSSLPYYEAATMDLAARFQDNALSGVLLTALLRISQSEARNHANLRGAQLVAGIELYGAEQEAYPENLSALVPDYLPVLPEDPFTGNAFRYALSDSGYVLYSAGEDMEDNGGVLDGHTGGTDILFHRE